MLVVNEVLVVIVVWLPVIIHNLTTFFYTTDVIHTDNSTKIFLGLHHF